MKGYDLAIIGGGIMGLMTAWQGAKLGMSIVLIDKDTIGNQWAASSGQTRSFRCDYLDPLYAELALKARDQWVAFEGIANQQFLIPAGCLNLASKAIGSIESSYASGSARTLKAVNQPGKTFDSLQLESAFPQFQADAAVLDTTGGVLLAQKIQAWLLAELKTMNVDVRTSVEVQSVTEKTDEVVIASSAGSWSVGRVIFTVGRAINEALSSVEGNSTTYPITAARPQENKYFKIPTRLASKYSTPSLPVFACLDVGIYGHPWVRDETAGVKIGYFNPSDVVVQSDVISSVADFVRLFMPELTQFEVTDVDDTDQGEYCMIDDDDFVIGLQPGYRRILVATGWRGTGFKFAPLVGSTLANAALTGKIELGTDRFSPERFANYG